MSIQDNEQARHVVAQANNRKVFNSLIELSLLDSGADAQRWAMQEFVSAWDSLESKSDTVEADPHGFLTAMTSLTQIIIGVVEELYDIVGLFLAPNSEVKDSTLDENGPENIQSLLYQMTEALRVETEIAGFMDDPELLRAEDFAVARNKLANKGVLLLQRFGRFVVDDGYWYPGLQFFEQALTMIRMLNSDTEDRADTIYQIARTHHLIGNLEKARTYYRDALRLYEHTDNQAGIAACKTGLGHLMTQMGFIDDAIKDLKSARRIYRKLGNKQEISKVDEILHLATKVKEKQPV